MISETTIRKVRELAIEDVLSPYVRLSQKGSTLMGLCPFHSEKTGSFAVTPSKNLFHCFSCNRGGDSITFTMEKENLSFSSAVEFIARNHNIPVEYISEERSEEQIAEARHRESLLTVLDTVQSFFLQNLRATDKEESLDARTYAYGRWHKEFCAFAGIGYAPKDGQAFMDFCRSKALNEELLYELGMFKRGEDGNTYAMFRQRIMIPVRNRWGRIIAYTARYIGDNRKAPKYINSATSMIYSKGETVFGIDRAARLRDADYYIIVEGAPDVLRMQSIGYDNTVASLGTAWSDNQFEQLKKYVSSLCFIPDSDIAEGKPYGPGFEAVMSNGAAAIRKGFHVTVRELPFAEIPSETEGEVQYAKNDADSYIRSKEDYTSLPEKHFIIWLAQKRFLVAGSMVEERKCVAEIADLLRYIKDQLVYDQCIEQLSRLHGKVKLWRDAVTQARGEARRRNDKLAAMNEMQREAELLRQFGLFVRENCYYSIGEDDDEPSRISNFIMEPLFHIEDEINGTRIFRMRNMYNVCRVIELKESELCSLSNFQQKVGSLGNYVWLAKIDKLNRVKEYLYSKTDTAERIRKLGWNAAEGFFAFGNGIFFANTFNAVDELGIVRGINGKAFYIPATSKIYLNNPEIFQFERLMVHENRNGIKLHDYVGRLMEVFGENASVAFCYLLATLFRDIIFRRTRHFPILNLFGEKGTGKTTLATSLQSFFLHGVDPPNLGVTSVPAMNDRVSQAVNTLAVLDEYKNDLDIRKIAYLKGLWGGGGQTKKNTKIKVIGVEPAGANCMQESLKEGHVLTLPQVNTIADGTAVKRPGEKLFPYIQQNVDDIITIEDSELIVAFLDMVENHKMIVENSGLLTVAALKHLNVEKKKIVSILSGGNMDVITMSSIVQHGLIQRDRVFTVSVLLPDKPGELAKVAELLAKEHGNIIKLEHNQFISINRNAAVELRITMEAFGTDHKNQIVSALTDAGYRPKLVKFKGTYSEM